MKISGIFYGNQYVSKYWIKIKKFFSNLIRIVSYVALIAFIIGIAMSGAYLYAKMTIKPEQAEAQTDLSTEMYKIKIEQKKDEIVDELVKCEGQTYKESDALMTYDPTASMKDAAPTIRNLKKILSFGPLQFKIGTVQTYEMKRSSTKISDHDAVTLALDLKSARELAKFVGFETKAKFSTDWTRCSKLLNLDNKVDMVHYMESQYR